MTTASSAPPSLPARTLEAVAYASQGFTDTLHVPGMTLREYAAIKLRVPDSGTDWLDDMIRQSLRDDFAAKSMQGRLAGDYPWSDLEFKPVVGLTPIENEAVLAYKGADAMLAERRKAYSQGEG